MRSQRYVGFTMLENGTERTYGPDDYSTDVFTDLAHDPVLHGDPGSGDPLEDDPHSTVTDFARLRG